MSKSYFKSAWERCEQTMKMPTRARNVIILDFEDFKQKISKLNKWSKEELENFLKKFLKEKNIKYPIFGKPLRFILTKSYDGPSISDIYFILGKKSSLERLNQYITKK